MGLEDKAKGINVILGPTIGPLGRIVTSGRNWVSYSNDPYLSGRLTAETVQATQGVGAITSRKHFIVNEVI
jgi:beta-glucosidase